MTKVKFIRTTYRRPAVGDLFGMTVKGVQGVVRITAVVPVEGSEKLKCEGDWEAR